MRRYHPVAILAISFLVVLSLLMVGCSSKPDAEQMKQLNDLKEEYASLQREVVTKEQAKANAQREIADKNSKLQKCNDDQQSVKQKLGK